jgi:hypothetical protein
MLTHNLFAVRQNHRHKPAYLQVYAVKILKYGELIVGWIRTNISPH